MSKFIIRYSPKGRSATSSNLKQKLFGINSGLTENLEYLFGFKSINSSRQLLLVIMVHSLAWLFFFSLPTVFFRIEIVDPKFIYKEIVNKGILIGFFYLNYFLFIPRFLLKKRIVVYILLLLFSLVILFLQQLFVERLVFKNHRRQLIFGSRTLAGGIQQGNIYNTDFRRIDSIRELRRSQGLPYLRGGIVTNFRPEFYVVLTNVLYPWFFMVLVSGFIHLIVILLRSRHEKKSLEMANLKAEINLLKSQVNPHFLFNTLNSIYSQVYHQSQNAAGSVLKLSEILRYVIYDTSNEHTSLEKDLLYITNYISLQRLRLSEKIIVDFSIKGESNDLVIAPLLLITFIENAFKHGISYTIPSMIQISVEIFNKTITMLVSNPVISNGIFETEGIGLKNARRRLDLLYSGKYWLEISRNQNLFVVNLKINLDLD
jgi:hypothetical protein